MSGNPYDYTDAEQTSDLYDECDDTDWLVQFLINNDDELNKMMAS